ncbi:MAG: dipeptide epimerase [Pirellulales bacterium]|nr:dipeptide epimerase [Pirellulales bacterium]
MKITRVEAWPVTMRLTEPYTAAYDVLESTTNVFLRIVTDRRVVGCGCAAPDQQATGETAEGVLNTLRTMVETVVKGVDPLRSALLRERLEPLLRDEPSAMAAVDMALYDIVGKRCELPLWKLLGGYRESIRTSVTIGIEPVDETVERARYFVDQGFQALKIKGGLDVEADVARVREVREAVGSEIALRFDANQGYTAEQALRFLDQVRDAGLETLEQPTIQAHPDLLGRVASRGSVPIMADESVTTLRGAFRLARDNLVDMLNVKLMKVGGIAEALKICAVARAARLDVMIGSMDESALGIAAGLHVALADPSVAYADLDGHLGLEGDPGDGAVRLHAGTLFPNDQPGLGFELRG